VLSHNICIGQDEATLVRVYVADLEAAETAALPDANKSCEFLLIYLKNHQQSLGTFVEIAHGHLRAKIGVVNIEDESFIVQSAVSEGLVEQRDQQSGYALRLTLKGRGLYEKVQKKASGKSLSSANTSTNEIARANNGGCIRDVFISHASEDKEDIARPLAEELGHRKLAVWFDEYEIKWGDSLRERIDEGLANSRFGIVILSPHFFAEKWPKMELDGLFAREEGGTKVILPIWHNVTKEDVAGSIPTLAGRLALETNRRSIPEIVDELMQLLRSDPSRESRS
jgi:hypothetical protein